MPLTKEERLANLAKGREAAKAKKAAAPPAVAGSDPMLAVILAKLDDLSGRIAAVEQRPAPPPPNIPQFVPMERSDPGGPRRTQLEDGLVELAQDKTLPVGTHGLRLPPELLRQFEQRFGQGDPVRIKRDANRPDAGRLVSEDPVQIVNGRVRKVNRMIEPITWGEVLDEAGSYTCQKDRNGRACGRVVAVGEFCPGCGDGPRVRKALWLSRYGVWKYKVVVPGLTGKLGDGFYDTELEPAA